MPSRDWLSRIVHHLFPVISSYRVVFADAVVQSDSATADSILLIVSVLQNVELKKGTNYTWKF
jgi:indole-3-glycerol phosphate synthase